MSRLSAQSIRKLCVSHYYMVQPFRERTKSNGRTFGLSPSGYDVRIAEDIWVWPLWGRLASTMEHFQMPVDVCADVKDKSTNARMFVMVQNTYIEPGWHGYLTLEITRLLPWPVKIKKGTPIAQIVFEWLDEPTEQTYRGKYQGQEAGPQRARLD